MSDYATKDSWENSPMPSEREELELADEFNLEEFEFIKKGVVPEVMEDKWFIYYEDNNIYFHRSWTGHCVYQVSLESIEGGVKINKAWKNSKNPDGSLSNADIETLRMLIKARFHRKSIKDDLLRYHNRE